MIVKTELNARGAPEFYHNQVAAMQGKPAPHPHVTELRDYVLYDHLRHVPQAVWSDPEAGVALAHNRLAIVDLTPAGNQPMESATGRYVTVWLTARPPVDGGFRSEGAEVAVLGTPAA